MHVSYDLRDGYLLITLTGQFATEPAKEVCLEGIEQARTHGFTRILCDFTALSGLDEKRTSVMERYNTGKFVAEALPPDFLLAVLETQQQIPVGQFAENVMVNRGAMVRVVTDLHEALQWLGVGEAEAPGEQ